MAQSDTDLHTPDNRQRLVKMILRLFDHWQLDTRDQAALLGLSVESRPTLSQYREGAQIADNQDLLDRVGHLLGIHKSLRLIFLNNIDLAYRWVTQPNASLDGDRPIDVMKMGLEGIIAVHRYLDKEVAS